MHLAGLELVGGPITCFQYLTFYKPGNQCLIVRVYRQKQVDSELKGAASFDMRISIIISSLVINDHDHCHGHQWKLYHMDLEI